MSDSFRIGFSIALLIAFAALVTLVGFYPAAILFLATHMAFLGIRPWWLIGGVALGVALAFYLLFERLLAVPVPSGSIW